ncbi:hypothetical protein DEO72_LG3g1250 [Vigna unguiculata]|uniref:Uncharacterized protein n=1 Tax=Vigna unguiculata TaxID=3917 RepID=A0A4D6LEP0_VIGUN|nr:hypothetical protein DEO72_LG3g1250 [Vigna unguiculata]
MLALVWIPLLEPELLDPELCVTSVTMNQNLSHHKGPWNYVPTTEARPRRRDRLAQASPPSPRRGLKEDKGLGNAGSRLSEIPLAWASCLLAQRKHRPKRLETKNSNFPYLGFKLAKRSDTPPTPNTRAQQLKERMEEKE